MPNSRPLPSHFKVIPDNKGLYQLSDTGERTYTMSLDGLALLKDWLDANQSEGNLEIFYKDQPTHHKKVIVVSPPFDGEDAFYPDVVFQE